MQPNRSEVLQRTFDLMILQTLSAIGPLHGYGAGWISSAWEASENNRKARFYSITRSGRKQLAAEAENWERAAGVVGRLLQLSKGR